ncbi:hypothetical protein FNV43_RR14438 [Rhamnella rubrinervis]|uniref:Uncharacterized protein n=1 Tax=Rhamnella rubrinervis TaxID=2594499 RepID=A0A8K0H2Z6_9ROSA|nr:hypothetical protein FNV43_RR14438 [Rhamnella rubrinervis]
MSVTSTRFIAFSSKAVLCTSLKNKSTATTIPVAQKSNEELLVVVGGGAAGVFGAIRAKSVAPNLNVVVFEQGKPLSKVRVSGGGRCNVTNGHCLDNMILAENYPRGHKEFRGSFFNMHGPVDTMTWFSDHGVELKGIPISNSSSSIIDCLVSETRRTGVSLQTGKVVRTVSAAGGKFHLSIENNKVRSVEHIEADYLLIASGNSRQGYSLASQLGHSIVDPVPSLFTFKTDDSQLTELSGVTFPKVKAKLRLENVQRDMQQFTQIGPMLVTHWGLSGPVILRLSAWGARDLFSSGYKGTVTVDFVPDLHVEDVKSILTQHKNQFAKQKLSNSYPSKFGLVKRFWHYMLGRQGTFGDTLWASVPNNSLISIASLLKQCNFGVTGKGQFKDEFVTAGGVPLSEISLSTLESKMQSNLFFAGEVLNVDGVTGGFNFQGHRLWFVLSCYPLDYFSRNESDNSKCLFIMGFIHIPLTKIKSFLWNEDLVRHLFDHQSAEAIMRIKWPRVDCQDKLIWIGNKTGVFSVKDCYLAAFCEGSEDTSDDIWDRLWKLRIHERLKIFLWRLLSGVLPTNQKIFLKTGKGVPECPLCGAEEESDFHLFKVCGAVRGLAFSSLWGCKLEAWHFNGIKDWIGFCINPFKVFLPDGLDKVALTTFLVCLFYTTWSFRNEVVFGGKRKMADYVNILNDKVNEFLTGFLIDKDKNPRLVTEFWKPPPSDWCKINVDAAFCEGNAALALIMRNEQGRVLYLASKLVTAASSYEAELKALEWGFGLASENNWSKICWSSDALVVVNEILSSETLFHGMEDTLLFSVGIS